MPAARGVKRTASKSSTSTASVAPKNKKKRNVVQLEVPTLPKRRGSVFTCGQGDVGQLGLGEDVIETSRFKHVAGLGEKIVDVCAGGMHTVAIDSDGKVWTFGCNDEGALGRATSGDGEEGSPAPVSLPARAVAVSAGDSHSAALLADGQVYAWGAFRDSHGSMGMVVRGREGKPCREPARVDIPEPAAEIASGSDHLVILTTSGSVYTMGCGEQGQLGRLSQRSATRDTRQGFSALLVPSKVTLKMGASRVWAGYHATVILDASADKVYAWGLNNYGQLGITGEKRKTALFSPTEASAFNALGCGWTAVACGQHHSLALDDKGQLYAVGRCEYGRLGLGERTGDAEALEPVPALANSRVVSIAAGTSNSFAVTDTGEVFAWGMGSEGQLGTGSCSDAPSPAPAHPAALAGKRARAVRAGGQHTVLLVEDPNAAQAASPAPDAETSDQHTGDEPSEPREPEPVPAKKARGRATKRGLKQDQEEEVSSTSSAAPAPPAHPAPPVAPQAKMKKRNPTPTKSVASTPHATAHTTAASSSKSRAKTSQSASKTSKSEAKTSKSEAKSSKSEAKSSKSEAKSNKSEAAGPSGTKKVNGDEKKETPMEVDETDSKQENKEETQEESKQATDTDITETKPDTSDTSSQDNATVPSETPDVEMKPEQPEPEQAEEKKAEVNGTPEEKKEVEIEAKTVESVQDTAAAGTTA